ncbi:hypothetical protein GQ44DRAFT_722922 [Phaeosphaeriaceae sp. PMI808]|nr:hypothetical protein GQ44DRAFT_722922 [Phaeosphaeriaceae sp. PMI808]
MAEFDQAHESFLAQLSDKERQQFAPIKDYKAFQAEIVKLSQSIKSRKSTKLFTVINKCGQHLASYFEVVGIVVQSHPEWAAIAWGSFRLILAPFEVRFSDILQRLDAHQGILRFEMDAIQLRTTATVALTQKEERQRADRLTVAFEQRLQAFNKLINHVESIFSNAEKQTLISRIASWINPTPFAETYERLCALRLEGTAEWILQTKEYRDWTMADSPNNFLWVRGNPGAGKSVLAAFVAQELLDTVNTISQEPVLTTYFFFEYNGDNGKAISRDQAYRAILAQLFHKFVDNKDILDTFAFAYTSNERHGQTTATTNELLDLMKILSPRIPNWYIVIDAIDECAAANELAADLNNVFKGVSTKLLLFSRTNVGFAKKPLKATQLQDILTPYEDNSQIKDQWSKRMDDENLADFETSTILVTGGLIEKRWSPQLSANNIPSKPLAGDMFKEISSTTLRKLRPFVDYAALYWPNHLFSMDIPCMIKNTENKCGSDRSIAIIMKTLEGFLSSMFTPMVWVELLYNFDITNGGHYDRRKTLKSWALSVKNLTTTVLSSELKVVSTAIFELTGHLEKLHELWGDILIQSPRQIWHDITGFTPNPFFVTTRAVSVKPLETDHSSAFESSQNPLVKISRDHSEKGLLAVLHIWPPKKFGDMAQGINFDFSGTDRFSGWTAQYEIWSITSDDPVVIEDSHVPLDPEEV